MGYRIGAIIAVLALAYAALIIKVYDVQIIHGSSYQAEAAEYDEVAGVNLPPRGSIYFMDDEGNQTPVAINKEFSIIYADPQAVQQAVQSGDATVDGIAGQLSNVTGIATTTLSDLITTPGGLYVPIVNKAPDSEVSALTTSPLPGINIGQEELRYYPFGPLASQVIGYVGPNSSGDGVSGKYGIEEEYNSLLTGSAASPASNITLTIDPNVQLEAEKILDQLVANNNASGGDVIVEDPQTGAILAMGSTPDFDPNDYASSSISDFLNTNVQSVYEPGSIMKVITMAAGLDSGKITADETYDDKGYVNVNGAHITNYNLTTNGPYGPGTTMTEVIEHSINTGAIWAENQIGNSIFLSYVKKFGLGSDTGIDLPGEVVGSSDQLVTNAPQVDWDTAAYGQGISVTPIELVTAISAIANGGVMMRPYLNSALQPEEIGRVISTSTASQVVQMMTDAVDLAQVANINGYSMAGKTGSAYIPNPAGGGYLNELTDSYIGFDAADPRFIAFIRLNTIPVTSLAQETVEPAWQQLAEFLLNYYNIPPNRTTNDVIPDCHDLICPN